jgi:hypothetical protein
MTGLMCHLCRDFIHPELDHARRLTKTLVGFHGGNSLVLGTILQRPPRSVWAFIEEFGR